MKEFIFVKRQTSRFLYLNKYCMHAVHIWKLQVCVYKKKVNLLYLLPMKQRKSVLVYLFKLSHRNTNFKKNPAIWVFFWKAEIILLEHYHSRIDVLKIFTDNFFALQQTSFQTLWNRWSKTNSLWSHSISLGNLTGLEFKSGPMVNGNKDLAGAAQLLAI